MKLYENRNRFRNWFYRFPTIRRIDQLVYRIKKDFFTGVVILILGLGLYLVLSFFRVIPDGWIPKEEMLMLLSKKMKYLIPSYVALLTVAFAFWRNQLIKRNGEGELFVKSIDLIKEGTAHESMVGAAHSLKILVAKDPFLFLIPSLSIMESTIRNLSEKSLTEWSERANDIRKTYLDRRRIPAIKEICEIMIVLYAKYKERFDLVPLDLAFCDLRGFDNEFHNLNQIPHSARIKNFLGESILTRADMRGLPISVLNQIEMKRPRTLFNSWVSVSKEAIGAGENEISIQQIREYLTKTKSRLFLRGFWNASEDINILFESGNNLSDYHVPIDGLKVGGGPNVIFDGLRMECVDFTNAFLPGASFVKTHFLQDCSFISADLRHADFTGAKGLNREMFKSADIEGAIFRKVGSSDNDLRGIEALNDYLNNP